MLRQHFFYRKDGLLKQIAIDDIIFLEADNNYTKFQEMNNFHYIRITLNAALSLLPENKFLRIHRSYAVSLDHIDQLGRESVTFTAIPNLELPVSRQYYATFKEKIVILDTAATDPEEVSLKKTPHRELQRSVKNNHRK
jgi:DNA-binding LytR/AlgR family response regulator